MLKCWLVHNLSDHLTDVSCHVRLRSRDALIMDWKLENKTHIVIKHNSKNSGMPFHDKYMARRQSFSNASLGHDVVLDTHIFNMSLSGSWLSIQEMWPWDVPEESLTALAGCFLSHPVVLCLTCIWWVHELKTSDSGSRYHFIRAKQGNFAATNGRQAFKWTLETLLPKNDVTWCQ